MTVRDVVAELIHHPFRSVVLRWHWKSATLSVMVRGGLFFATNIASGIHAATQAAVVETVIAAPMVGVFAAGVQAFRFAEPAWAATLIVTAVFPVFAQTCECVVHWIAGTPQLRTSLLASVALSTASTLFSLFTMRRGVMVVGSDSRPFLEDLRQLPLTLAQFAAASTEAIARALTCACRALLR